VTDIDDDDMTGAPIAEVTARLRECFEQNTELRRSDVAALLADLSVIRLRWASDVERRDAQLAELRAEVSAWREALRSVVAEADFVISGGDNPPERCTECGLAGIGMLRDALRAARELIASDGRKGRR
jgi:hypothetical protein